MNAIESFFSTWLVDYKSLTCPLCGSDVPCSNETSLSHLFLDGKYLTFDSEFEHSNAKTAHLSPGIVHQEKKDGDR